jgi:hypothetical protein
VIHVSGLSLLLWVIKSLPKFKCYGDHLILEGLCSVKFSVPAIFHCKIVKQLFERPVCRVHMYVYLFHSTSIKVNLFLETFGVLSTLI